jgi:hypothetical protein
LNETYEFIDSNKDKSGEKYLWRITRNNVVDSFVSGDGVEYSVMFNVETIQKMELVRTSIGGCKFIDSFTMNFVKSSTNQFLFPKGKVFCQNAEIFVQYPQDFIISNDAYWQIQPRGTIVVGQLPLTIALKDTGYNTIELNAIDSLGCANFLIDTIYIIQAPNKPIISTINYNANSGVSLKVGNPSTKTYWNNDFTRNDTLYQYVYEPGADTIVTIFVNTVNDDGCISDTTEVRFGFKISSLKSILSNPLLLYPNPTKGKIFAKIPTGIKNAQILIYSYTGKVVKQQEVNGQSSLELNLSLSPGLYFVVLRGDDFQSGSEIVIE